MKSVALPRTSPAPATGVPGPHPLRPVGLLGSQRALVTLHPQDLRLMVVGLGLSLRHADGADEGLRARTRELGRMLFNLLPAEERAWVAARLRPSPAPGQHTDTMDGGRTTRGAAPTSVASG